MYLISSGERVRQDGWQDSNGEQKRLHGLMSQLLLKVQVMNLNFAIQLGKHFDVRKKKCTKQNTSRDSALSVHEILSNPI